MDARLYSVYLDSFLLTLVACAASGDISWPDHRVRLRGWQENQNLAMDLGRDACLCTCHDHAQSDRLLLTYRPCVAKFASQAWSRPYARPQKVAFASPSQPGSATYVSKALECRKRHSGRGQQPWKTARRFRLVFHPRNNKRHPPLHITAERLKLEGRT